MKRNQYTKPKLIECKVCNNLISPYNFSKHINDYHEGVLKYVSIYGLYRQNKLKQPSKKVQTLVTCLLCNNQFYANGMACHLRDTHNTTVELYLSNHSEYRPSKLRKILIFNNCKNRIQCKVCYELFVTEKAFDIHLKSIHNLETKLDYVLTYIFYNLPQYCKCGCGLLVTILLYPPYRRDYLQEHIPHPTGYVFNELVKRKMSLKAKERFKGNYNASGWHSKLSRLKVAKAAEINSTKFLKLRLEKYNVTYLGVFDEDLKKFIYKYRCNKCNNIIAYIHKASKITCSVCNNNEIRQSGSKEQQSLQRYIEELLSVKLSHNVWNLIPFYLIDLYSPLHKIAILYNGLRFHTDKILTSPKYHLVKTKLCLKNSIQLIHIFSDLWYYKKLIVKERLKHIFKCQDNKQRVYARNCIIKLITPSAKNNFLLKYHIQGKDNSKYKLGAFYNDKLVAVMTFSTPRILMNTVNKNDGTFLLSRFAVNFDYIVVGGASKLLTYFIKNYNPLNIYSYADKRWTSGIKLTVYDKIGFTRVEDTAIGYTYTKDCLIRLHRFNFTKSKLVKMGYDKNKTLYKIMLLLGYLKVWDCGNLKYLMIIK